MREEFGARMAGREVKTASEQPDEVFGAEMPVHSSTLTPNDGPGLVEDGVVLCLSSRQVASVECLRGSEPAVSGIGCAYNQRCCQGAGGGRRRRSTAVFYWTGSSPQEQDALCNECLQALGAKGLVKGLVTGSEPTTGGESLHNNGGPSSYGGEAE
ncbi:hypothetical protein SARC_08181 [Sphaeroforma arctica JP610]|uniref:Uncharacterized protein n=1 Tax=Sphaeroforma arctica JP610 TaxID=667725 RepID=A0A0L0FRH3_9EUKA|nr:hypothetical protein SARC_08181 [Sphaeroforma arctica JP610]KNC79427.1 hypothetical protein SARC_08181 [Sphaeroforma arctica JP610]|eukprot:XP_014153329.1 hypothetical protein SARC_08181 [Sphaeroforma arctica JP610]